MQQNALNATAPGFIIQHTFSIFHAHDVTPFQLRLTMRPSSMRTMRSAICASSSLWVIMTMVCENRSLVIFNSPITSWLVRESRFPVGSSASVKIGLTNFSCFFKNRVGGNSSFRGISDLSHHRAYRSVHGGSTNLTSDSPFGVVVYHGD